MYSDPADIDLYVGIMLEEPLSGGQLGPTASFMIGEQFRALKRGDRFFYESIAEGTDNFTQGELIIPKTKIYLFSHFRRNQ